MAAVSARRMRGPRRDGAGSGERADELALLRREAALGADQQGGRAGIGGEHVAHGLAAGFVGEEERAVGGPVLQQARQADQLGQLGQGSAAALLGGLDEMGVEPLEIDLVDHAALGAHGDQPGDAELAGLFGNEGRCGLS